MNSSFVSDVRVAYDDIRLGFSQSELWTRLAQREIRVRYHRSLFGPLWTTFSLGIFVLALSALYGGLMGHPLETYTLHLILGMLVWNFISQVIMDGCSVYIQAAHFIKGVGMPISVFVFDMLWRNVIIFSYQLILFLLAIVYLQIVPSLTWLLSLFGLLLILLNATWLGLIVGVIATRYRDFSEVMATVLRIGFFLTPIIWIPGPNSEFQLIANSNPVYHLIETFRAPLQGDFNVGLSVLISMIICVIGWSIAIPVFGHFRNRIPFWI